jgi:NTP pyrophosphatase (non-canonical NTP hydrolase)
MAAPVVPARKKVARAQQRKPAPVVAASRSGSTKVACARGGNEVELSDETTSIAHLRGLMTEFVTERNWWKYHNPKNLAISISLEASELLEHFQWVDSSAAALDANVRQQVEEEMSDVLAYLMSLSHVLGIDLASAFRRKMRKNAVKYPADRFQGTWEKA